MLWAKIHTGYIDHLKLLGRVGFVVALHNFLQLREDAQALVAFELLLAFPASQNDLSLPRHRIRSQFVSHPRLDAGFAALSIVRQSLEAGSPNRIHAGKSEGSMVSSNNGR
jgi:hypothetical protein